MVDFKEGESYEVSELPDSDMTNSGTLEVVDDGVFAARYGDYYVTFERQEIVCTDVTHVNDLGE